MRAPPPSVLTLCALRTSELKPGPAFHFPPTTRAGRWGSTSLPTPCGMWAGGGVVKPNPRGVLRESGCGFGVRDHAPGMWVQAATSRVAFVRITYQRRTVPSCSSFSDLFLISPSAFSFVRWF